MPQLNFGLVVVISSNVVLIQLYVLRMAMTLIMFINITQKLHGVRRMGCRSYGVWDVRDVGRTGCETYGMSVVRGVGRTGCRSYGV